jgi:hypothetical protein
MLTEAFYARLASHPKNSLNEVEKLFIAYRCFKECRNAIMHDGGTATARAAAAYQAYTSLTPADLRSKELPICPPVVAGDPIVLSLRGVVGFSDVILRLIATLDAEFACTARAENEFRVQWHGCFKASGRTNQLRYNLSTANIARRTEQIGRLVVKLGLPRPSKIGLLDRYLTAEGLVR